MESALSIRYPRLVSGSIIVLAGVILLLGNTGIIQGMPISSIWELWPSLFIILGLYKFAEAFTPAMRSEAWWLIFFGLWLQASYIKLFGWGFGKTWPILVVGFGIKILWKSFDANRHIAEGTINGN